MSSAASYIHSSQDAHDEFFLLNYVMIPLRPDSSILYFAGVNGMRTLSWYVCQNHFHYRRDLLCRRGREGGRELSVLSGLENRK